MRPRYLVCVVVLGALSCSANALTTPTSTVMVKMTDGTELATDCYLPKEGGPSWPTIVARTIYPRSMAMYRVDSFLKDGYACVVQDTRGMGGSKGKKGPFFTDGWREGLRDGADTIAWVKAQPWCNGKIATYGESALGATQVLLAPVTRDVACQVIELAPSNFFHNMAYQGGVWHKNLAEGWMFFLGMGGLIPDYKAHTTYDEFWTFYNAEAKAAEVTAPAIHVGGWYDIFQQGTINNFVTRQQQGGPGAKGNQKLVMEGRAHTGYDSRDYKFKATRRTLNVGKLCNDFMAYWLKGEPNGVMQQPAVSYYVLGDDTDPNAPGNEWRTADTWPPFPTQETPFYLAPDGVLARAATTEAATASFVFDPGKPFPTHGGANLLMPAGPFDQRKVRADRTDLLRFTSAPLTAPLEVTGTVSVKLYVSTDAADTDFTAKLVDVYPAGDEREILVLDGIQRVKFRNGFEKPAPPLTSPDEIVEVTVDLWNTSWVFNTNHRLGVHISSSNYPRFDVNPNTGDDYADSGKLRTAHNTVHLGKAHPSALVLPLKK